MIGTGYSDWKYNRKLLQQRLDMLLPTIKVAAEDTDAGCLIVSGTSGVWLGSILTMQQDLPVVLVRKPGEQSHGSMVEGDTHSKRGLVVDDFISSGATINRISAALEAWSYGLNVVGVIEHGRPGDSGYGPSYDIYNTDVDGRTVRVATVPVFACDHAQRYVPVLRVPKAPSYLDSIMF